MFTKGDIFNSTRPNKCVCLMGLFQPHALAASRYGLKLGGWKLNDLFRQHFYLLAMLTFLTGHKQCTLQDLNNLSTTGSYRRISWLQVENSNTFSYVRTWRPRSERTLLVVQENGSSNMHGRELTVVSNLSKLVFKAIQNVLY